MAAAHLGRTCADRSRLSLLRRPAARSAARATRTVSAVEARLRQQAGDDPLIDDLLSSASHVLSEVSRHVGFAIAPANAQAIFHRIEFVPLSRHTHPRRRGRARQSGVAEDRRHRRGGRARRELVQAANFLNTEFSGRTLDEVREGVLERLREERTLYDQLLGLALRLASSSLENLEQPDGLHRRHVVAARRGRARRAGCRWRRCARCS